MYGVVLSIPRGVGEGGWYLPETVIDYKRNLFQLFISLIFLLCMKYMVVHTEKKKMV